MQNYYVGMKMPLEIFVEIGTTIPMPMSKKILSGSGYLIPTLFTDHPERKYYLPEFFLFLIGVSYRLLLSKLRFRSRIAKH